MVNKRVTTLASLRQMIGLAATIAGVAAVGCSSLPQPPKAATPSEARGRHVLQIASSCGCHGANFAGWRRGGPDDLPRTLPFGERFVTPFGAIPAANITPDADTGISGWTDAQWDDAIANGVNPGGEHLSPAMPSRAYHGMAVSDRTALIAYLHRIHPVRNEVPAKTLRLSLSSSVALPDAPADPPTEPVALGRYLVRHVSVCADCHSSGDAGTEDAPMTGKMLPMNGELVAVPNITPDRETGIGAWSEADIARYLRTGTRPDGGLAQSAMAGLILSSFSHLTPTEAHAIAAYLRTLPPVRHRPGPHAT